MNIGVKMKLKYWIFVLFLWGVMIFICSVREEFNIMTNQKLFQYTYIHAETRCNCTKIRETLKQEYLRFRSKIVDNSSTFDDMNNKDNNFKTKVVTLQKLLLDTQNRPQDDVYNFNVTKSDVTDIDRVIPDTRPRVCRKTTYDITKLPKASVVIPFYNEALSMLMRTIHSILSRTPDRLLHEIILIDDSSTYTYLHKPLETYINLFPKMKLFRNEKRVGLIQSRLRGAEESTAPILVFLDANTECNVGWLEPILARLVENPKAVIQPFIDGIDIENLLYASPDVIFRSSFSWDLRFTWLKTPDHLQHVIFRGDPYFTPTLVGCAIAVNKSNFERIGGFDSGQLIWGGENIELSFRTWMCGGQVITLPCSRIGHMFKTNPYIKESNWAEQVQRNLMRIAEVWMDDYKRYFYRSTTVFKSRRVNLSETEWYSLEKRKQLRLSLKCQSFQWYLDNVIPEIQIPSHDALQHGEITNYESRACWKVLDDGYIVMTYECFMHRIIPQNIFTLDKYGLLRYEDKCVKLMFPLPTLRVVQCPDAKDVLSFSRWGTTYSELSGDDYVVFGWLTVDMGIDGDIRRWCVPHVTSAVPPHMHEQMPQVLQCDVSDRFQYWSFTYRFDSSVD